MTASKPDASPKSPVELLTDWPENLSVHRNRSSDDWLLDHLTDEQTARCRAALSQHQAEQPQDVVERVAKAICRAGHDSDEDFQSAWDEHAVGYTIEAKAAIAAMGDGSATIAPVSAENVQPITSASEAYHKVKQALEIANATGLYYHECAESERVELCRKGEAKINEALTVLPTLIALASSERRDNPNFPMGAIENGRAFINRLDVDCHDETAWDELKRCFEYMAAYLLSNGMPDSVDIEAGAIACSQWVYGVNHGAPSWDRLSEEHRNEYHEQAKACARAWGMKYVG